MSVGRHKVEEEKEGVIHKTDTLPGALWNLVFAAKLWMESTPAQLCAEMDCCHMGRRATTDTSIMTMAARHLVRSRLAFGAMERGVE